MPDEILSKQPIFHDWFNLLRLELRLANGETVERTIVEHPSGAAVLPYDPERRVAMVITEARPPVLHFGISPFPESIAGALDDDAPDVCARREAMEEGGVRLGGLEHVALVWMTPSTTTERVDLYLAEYRAKDRVGPGGGLDTEQEHVRVREMPLKALWRQSETGTLRDMKLLALLQALRLRRAELFSE